MNLVRSRNMIFFNQLPLLGITDRNDCIGEVSHYLFYQVEKAGFQWAEISLKNMAMEGMYDFGLTLAQKVRTYCGQTPYGSCLRSVGVHNV